MNLGGMEESIMPRYVNSEVLSRCNWLGYNLSGLLIFPRKIFGQFESFLWVL